MINSNLHKLVLYNDTIHTYQYIMASLIKFCNHHPLQAEQCAVITNNNGKCVIKEGSDFLEILEIKEKLKNLEIITEIESYESYMH